MGGLDQSPLDRLQDEGLQRDLPVEVEHGGRPLLPVVDGSQILGPAEILAGLSQQYDRVALILEPLRDGAVGLLDQSDHPDDRRRVDRQPPGLIVEAHVPAHHGNLQGLAGIGNPLDGEDELPHDVRPLRVPEIEAIGQGQRPGAGADKVARGLSHGDTCADVWIEHAVETVAVRRDGERLVRPFDPQDRGVRPGAEHGVGLDHVVVLLEDPSLVGNRGRGQKRVEHGVAVRRLRNQFKRQRLQMVLVRRRRRRPLVLGGVVRQRARGDFGHNDALVFDPEEAVSRDAADHGGIHVPFLADVEDLPFTPWLGHEQHPLL